VSSTSYHSGRRLYLIPSIFRKANNEPEDIQPFKGLFDIDMWQVRKA
jgi:hypothetical protein